MTPRRWYFWALFLSAIAVLTSLASPIVTSTHVPLSLALVEKGWVMLMVMVVLCGGKAGEGGGQ